MMQTKDRAYLGFLVLLAIGMWFSDRAWMPLAGDALPILAGFAGFYHFAKRWEWNEEEFRLRKNGVVWGVGLLLLGNLFAANVLLALGWVALLWSWLVVRIKPNHHRELGALLVLPLLSFPWLLLDGQEIGWYFRLSGACAVEWFLHLIGLNVHREGVQMIAQGLPIQITPACSGLNALQTLLLAGSYLAFSHLGATARYGLNLVLLIGLAWIANVIRIILLCVIGLSTSAEFAMGTVHPISGILAIGLMFGLCHSLFTLQAKRYGQSTRREVLV